MKSTILAVVLGLAVVAGCSDDDEAAPATSSASAESADESSSGSAADSASDDAPATTSPTTASDVATTEAADSTEPSDGTTPPTTAQAVIDIENQPGEGTFVGALEDADFTCDATATGWQATGTVTNPTDATVGYRIYVSFIDGAGETVALLEVEEGLADVAAGEERPWEVGFDSEVADLTCVARVERRAA